MNPKLQLRVNGIYAMPLNALSVTISGDFKTGLNKMEIVWGNGDKETFKIESTDLPQSTT